MDIIQGQYDTIMTLEQMNKKFESFNIKQDIHLIKDCGHMSIWEKPEELFNIIKQFCK